MIACQEPFEWFFQPRTLPIPPHVKLAPARQVPIEEYLARKASQGLDKCVKMTQISL